MPEQVRESGFRGRAGRSDDHRVVVYCQRVTEVGVRRGVGVRIERASQSPGTLRTCVLFEYINCIAFGVHPVATGRTDDSDTSGNRHAGPEVILETAVWSYQAGAQVPSLISIPVIYEHRAAPISRTVRTV